MFKKTACTLAPLQNNREFPAHFRLHPLNTAAPMAKTTSQEKVPVVAPEKPKRSFARKHGLKFATAASVALLIADQFHNIQPDAARALLRSLRWLASDTANTLYNIFFVGFGLGLAAKGVHSLLSARKSKKDEYRQN